MRLNKSNNLLIIFLLALIMFCFTYSINAQKIELTPKEQKFIEDHPTVTIAVMKRFPPFSYLSSADNSLKGFSIDLIKLLANKTGLEFDFKAGFWSDNLAKFKDNKVDIIQGISYREKRAKYTLYTTPYYKLPLVIYLREDSSWYESPADLAGKEVGVTKTVFYRDLLKEDLNVELVEKENNEKMMTDLSFGKLDAVVTNLSIGKYYIQQNVLNNIKLAGEYSHPKIEEEDLRFGVQKEMPILKGILQKGLAAISETEWTRLKDKWLGVSEVNDTKGLTESLLNKLTAAEKRYLANKDKLKIAVNDNWMPFEEINHQAEYKGILAQFYNLISQKLAMPIKVVNSNSWSRAVEAVKEGRVDILSAAVKRRDQGIDLTKSYIKYPLVIATKRDKVYISDLTRIKDEKIGITYNCPFKEMIQNNYPELNLQQVDGIKKGLEKVQNGKLFGLINTAPTVGYIIQQENMFDLKISGELSQKLALRIGVNPKDKTLLSILDKVLTTVNTAEKDRIFNDWLAIDYQQGFNYSLFIKGIFAVSLIGFFLLYRQWQLKKFNQKLSSVNQELSTANQKLENMSFIDGLTQIPNRRKFDEVYEKEWQHCRREKEPISVIMFDLDYFKEFNDLYGHLAGDDCLIKIAEQIDEVIKRPRDLFARYGGEEFVVVLPEIEADGAKKVAQKMKNAIVELEIEHQKSKISSYVTASFGVATIIPEGKVSRSYFLNKVDESLYQAKKEGRNRIKVNSLTDQNG